ncbi:MAG TPA: ribosome maturation factor RimM [Actinomycetota bacterium]|nr:ribosome maturation factor RimM [Actinomycetota bacterium]
MVGEILKAHGVRGEVVVRSYTENPGRFQRGSTVWIGREAGDAREMVVASSRVQQPGRLLVGFDPPIDRTAAEALRGLMVFAGGEDLPDLPDGAYWERDLVGLAVRDPAGRQLGVIRGVLARAEQDLWEVETPAGVVLVPAAKEIVLSVDLEAGQVTVDAPAGLFADEGAE